MEGQPVVKALIHKLLEVLARDRCAVGAQLQLDLLAVFHCDNNHDNIFLSFFRF